MAMQEGLHPKLLKELLLSFLGEDNCQTFEDELDGTNKSDLHWFLQKIETRKPVSPNARKLSDFILELNEAAIGELLKEMSTPNLAMAVSDISGKALTKIFTNISPKGALALKETIEQMKPLSNREASHAQEQLVKAVSELKKRGII
jgi:hypothetical protein